MRRKEKVLQTPFSFTFRDSGKVFFSQMILGKGLIYMQHYVTLLAH